MLVIINEGAGGGSAGIFDFVRHVGVRGHEVVVRYVSEGVRLPDLVSDATAFDRVIAAGGDGTASAICFAVRKAGTPVLPYPAGTANLLANNLGLPPEPAELARIALEGPVVRFDLGEIDATGPDGNVVCSGFILMAGAGYDAQIMLGAAPLKSTLGAAAYLAAALVNPAPVVASLTLELDDAVVETDGFAVLITNFAKIQFALPLTPGADPADGRFEVAVATGRNVAGLLPTVAAVVLDRMGDYPDRGPGVTVHSASTVRVTSDPPLRVQWDGEATEATTPFTARILPKAMQLVVPFGSAFVEPKPA